MKLPDKLLKMEPYIVAEGSFRVKLDANESPFTLPPEILDEISQALARVELNRYPDPYLRALRERAAAYYGVSASNITAGNGSDELINVIISAFIPQCGKIVVATPDFSMYEFYAQTAECEIAKYRKKDGLFIDADEFIAHIKHSSPDLVIFSNPCNPTGQGLKREDMGRVLNACDCLVVLDEAYMDFWDQSLLPGVIERENVIVLKTCSKDIGLAALRLGFAIANETLISYIDSARSPYNVNALTQAAGVAALGHPDTLRAAAKTIIASADGLREGLSLAATLYDVEFIPTITNFALLRTKHASEIYEKLRERGIIIRLLSANTLRITAGTQDENRIFLDALYDILEGFK